MRNNKPTPAGAGVGFLLPGILSDISPLPTVSQLFILAICSCKSGWGDIGFTSPIDELISVIVIAVIDRIVWV
ncbi:MAG: hypothetical protein DIZ78_00730 [endosymbiont of Escarpia spicata]|uniref:Uncharacterized protein n=1 Tax=endosymbiont of Escarpia spicata TaxID=2200908 RepID=A0A370DV57_9GAMM|nr:MAG: hypothetical protein DIZ78_00730 [endosymbiont of Escarpia spicata]